MKEISAGGVVYKRENGQIKLLLIEDRYMKTSLPKGKVEPGETLEQTALREIREETGIEGQIESHLEKIEYQYYHPTLGTVDKEVHYYLVEALAGSIQAQIEEINRAVWLDPAEAWEQHRKSGYENNFSVLEKAYTALGLKKGNAS